MLPAGSYQYELNGGGPFVGGNGTFTVGGPTTVYPEYTLTNQTFWEGSQDTASNSVINSSTAVSNATKSTAKAVTPFAQPSGEANITFVEEGLPTWAKVTWYVVLSPGYSFNHTTSMPIFQTLRSHTSQLPE
jgi:hypothetical protein